MTLHVLCVPHLRFQCHGSSDPVLSPELYSISPQLHREHNPGTSLDWPVEGDTHSQTLHFLTSVLLTHPSPLDISFLHSVDMNIFVLYLP